MYLLIIISNPFTLKNITKYTTRIMEYDEIILKISEKQ